MAVRIKKLKPPFWRKAEGKESWQNHIIMVHPMAEIRMSTQDERKAFWDTVNGMQSANPKETFQRYRQAKDVYDCLRATEGPEKTVEPFCIFYIQYCEEQGWL